MRLMLVVGARPQVIKSAPIIHEARKHDEIELQFVHTGQHYDFEMSRIFLNEMALPEPLVNLGVGSGTHACQTGRMMVLLEKTMIECKPDVVMVPGDTNSTLAGALVAVKLHVPVAHVEAGARSYDMKMPEEVNRRLTDHCSSLLFAPTRNCARNLYNENVPGGSIRLSGDPMYDALLQHTPAAMKSKIMEKLDLNDNEYALLTLHRSENVDNSESLGGIMEAIMMLKELPIVFPVHPRTKQRLAATTLLKRLKAARHVKLIEPVGYHEMLNLTKHARTVITDSGGVQKEAFWLRTPCVTLRDRTEWVETINLGANVLVGDDSQRIVEAARRALNKRVFEIKSEKMRNPFGDGQAARRIVKTLETF